MAVKPVGVIAGPAVGATHPLHEARDAHPVGASRGACASERAAPREEGRPRWPYTVVEEVAHTASIDDQRLIFDPGSFGVAVLLLHGMRTYRYSTCPPTYTCTCACTQYACVHMHNNNNNMPGAF